MRLWHYELIGVLPRKQLIAQWRELCCIIKNIADNGTPNHLLVNKVLSYPINDFKAYSEMVINEIEKRGYEVSKLSLLKFKDNLDRACIYFDNSKKCSLLFHNWHDDRYLTQCFFNLQEKYDCGGITPWEFELVQKEYNILKYGNSIKRSYFKYGC